MGRHRHISGQRAPAVHPGTETHGSSAPGWAWMAGAALLGLVGLIVSVHVCARLG
ncbi:hypothetical protein [Nocardioides mangrovi]|uniref:Uncharacterized protein n=1 Tax=Nocardioides mangrovi TaxID=2874580 RepID=A0ABS7UJ86_9ACTN|nr:hypothetical protein [Nocardioides mangrovi]MBZ5740652.1 hypothetical protein [Nocardioides mangrovi]